MPSIIIQISPERDKILKEASNVADISKADLCLKVIEEFLEDFKNDNKRV